MVLGADSVRADGSVVNKVGSYPLAVTASSLGVPVYVLCETLKIAAPSFPLTLEEMEPGELLPEPVAGITVRNIYFDRTPAEYISGVVTEEGVLDVEAIAARAAGRWGGAGYAGGWAGVSVSSACLASSAASRARA